MPLSYGPLVVSAVAGQQLHGTVSTGNALNNVHNDGLKAHCAVMADNEPLLLLQLTCS